MDFLATVDVLSGVRSSALSKIAYAAKKRLYRRGDTIASMGMLSVLLFQLLLTPSEQGTTVGHLRIVEDGEVCVVDGVPRRIGVQAPGKLEACAFSTLTPKSSFGTQELFPFIRAAQPGRNPHHFIPIVLICSVSRGRAR